MGQETIEVADETSEEIATDEDVIRMICLGVIQNDGNLDRETLESILEATNRRQILDEAQVFVDEGGLEDDEESDGEEDDDPEEGEENDEDEGEEEEP